MAVTRRGDTIYLNDGYSDTAFYVEIATSPYGSDKYRVKAACESDALEMVLRYKLSKGRPYPFQTEELWNNIYGDERWMDDCVYVDPGYWICISDFIIRRVEDSPGGSRSVRGGSQTRAVRKPVRQTIARRPATAKPRSSSKRRC